MHRRAACLALLLVVPACAAPVPHGRSALAPEPRPTVARDASDDGPFARRDPRGGRVTGPDEALYDPDVPWGWKRPTEAPVPWGRWRLGPRERTLPYEYDPDRREYRFPHGGGREDVLAPARGECAPERDAPDVAP